ncbi:MAG: ribonuclease E/G [Firmicutes bacterium]|nr:ribonuclease E/G [Bacillota bacterium]
MQTEQNRLLIDSVGCNIRIACMANDKLKELFIDSKQQTSMVGDVILGTVKRVLPSKFAFIDIGHEKIAFMNLLPDQKLKLGDNILVQVSKDATSGVADKGAKVQDILRLKSRLMILYPTSRPSEIGISKKIVDKTDRKRLKHLATKYLPTGFGCVLRTESTTVTEQALQADFIELYNLHNNLAQKAQISVAPKLLHKAEFIYIDLLTDYLEEIIVNSESEFYTLQEKAPQYKEKIKLWDSNIALFEAYNVEKQIKNALNRNVWLNCGGFITFDPVEACIVIDVNTGKYSGKGGYSETALKTNLEAAQAITEQIALRNLSGIIIIDFIDMPNKADRQSLLTALKTALAKIRIPPNVVTMSDTGLVQLIRRKQREPLYKILQTTCPHCNGLGRVDKL